MMFLSQKAGFLHPPPPDPHSVQVYVRGVYSGDYHFSSKAEAEAAARRAECFDARESHYRVCKTKEDTPV